MIVNYGKTLNEIGQFPPLNSRFSANLAQKLIYQKDRQDRHAEIDLSDIKQARGRMPCWSQLVLIRLPTRG
jgi:hypothetical protein